MTRRISHMLLLTGGLLVTPAAFAVNPEPPALAERVRKELITLPWYGVFDILSFRLEGDAVVLSGKVTRPTLKSDAEAVVRNVEGVSKVENRIEVLPLSGHDDRIRLAAYRMIYGHSALERYALRAMPSIHIVVENGKLELVGSVANEGDRNIAGMQARSVPGAFEVVNNLKLEKD